MGVFSSTQRPGTIGFDTWPYYDDCDLSDIAPQAWAPTSHKPLDAILQKLKFKHVFHESNNEEIIKKGHGYKNRQTSDFRFLSHLIINLQKWVLSDCLIINA